MEQKQQQEEVLKEEVKETLSEEAQKEIVKNELALIPEAEKQGLMKIITENDLVKIGTHKKKLTTLKRKYGGNKIQFTNADDAEMIKLADDAARDLRKFRTAIDDERKEIVAPMNNGVKFVNGKYSPIIDDTKELEAPIKKIRDDFKAAIEAKEKEAEIALQNRVNSRIQSVIDAGMAFDGSYYSIGSEEFGVPTISLGIADFQTMTDAVFDNTILPQIIEKNALITEAQTKKDEAARIAKEEEEAEQERQRVQRIKDQEKIDADKKALEDEKAEMRRTRIESRGEQLEMMGLVKQVNGSYALDEFKINSNEMADMPAQQWSALIADYKKGIQHKIEKAEQDKKNKEAADKRKAIINARYEQLFALGMKFNGQYGCYMYEDVNVDNATEICLFNEEEWNALIEKITPVIAKRKEYNKLRQDLITIRSFELTSLGMEKKIDSKLNAIFVYEDVTINENALPDYSDEEWADIFATLNLKKENLRNADLLKQRDKAIWEDFITRLKAVPFPDLQSDEYRKKSDKVRDFIYVSLLLL